MLGLIPVLSRIRFKIKGAFFADVARENDSRMRITAWMLIRVVRKQKPKRLKQRPFFYGNSTRIFRGKGADVGLSELLVKSYIRSGTQWRLGIQFVVLLCAVLLLLPSGIQLIAWLVAALLLTLWRKAYCKDALTAPFLKMFPVKDEDKHQALRKATPLLVLPAFLLISLCFGFTLMVWWGPLLMLAAAIPVVYFFSTIVTSWY
ncbi:Bacterial ABC transporter protein EcsB [compost metagenome]